MVLNKDDFLNNLSRICTEVILKLPEKQAHYDSLVVHEIERWCANNCKTDFQTIIYSDNYIMIRFICMNPDEYEQATIDAVAFKLRWV